MPGTPFPWPPKQRLRQLLGPRGFARQTKALLIILNCTPIEASINSKPMNEDQRRKNAIIHEFVKLGAVPTQPMATSDFYRLLDRINVRPSHATGQG